MRKIHHIEAIGFQNDMLILQIDGKEHRFRINEVSRRLAAASLIEKNMRYHLQDMAFIGL